MNEVEKKAVIWVLKEIGRLVKGIGTALVDFANKLTGEE